MPTLNYYFGRVRELGLRESFRQFEAIVADRAARRIHGVYDRYFHASHEEQADKFIRKLSPGALEEMRIRRQPQFFLDHDPEFYQNAIREHFPDELGRIVEAANRILAHEFDLLGSGPRRFGKLPWHEDFKSGYRWDRNVYYREIRYGHLAGVDVKVPWELSRFQHSATLGQAYWLTGNEAYAGEFRAQVLDWIAGNPYKQGVNWACTMDVGIRAVNWIWGFYFFRRSAAIDEQFLNSFLRSLFLHARFIRSNLEYRTATIRGEDRRLNSNHYLSNLIGLLYISLMFPELADADDNAFAKKELFTEIFEQTYPDGADYEHSTFYHRLVTEIFLSAVLLLKRNGHAVPPEVEERLQRMGAYTADYLRPDGTAPQIGDADNGRLHPLSLRNMSDHRYIPQIIASSYGNNGLRVASGDPEALWWIADTPTGSSEYRRDSAIYANRGFAILRCEPAHVFVCAAGVGMHGLGSHSHNDILSFEYWSQQRAWIVDPGTYLYTPDAESRNHFRSTEAHNTVRIDGAEINPFQSDRLFQMTDRAHVKCNSFLDNEDVVEFDAEHNGYDVVHRRRLRLDKVTGDLEVQDSFQGEGSHGFEWFFHTLPGTVARTEGNCVTLCYGASAIALQFEDESIRCDNAEGWYSPSYGVRQRATVISAATTRQVPFKMSIRITNSHATDSRYK